MTQPPNQPPQGGFGAPQDPPPHGTPPPPPQQPPAQPAGQPGYGYPQQPPTPPAGQPGYGYPQQSGGFGPPQQPGGFGQPQQPGPYAPQQQPGPYTQPQYGYPPQQQYPTVPGGGPGGGGRNPFKGKPAVLIGAAVALVLVAGGVVWAVTSGGDDDKPVAKHTSSPGPSASADEGDGSGNGGSRGDDPEDFNADRQPGEAKVLWYKGAPDAPGNGAEANGMWVTDKIAAKAAYKQLFGYNVANGSQAWEPITFPQEICATSKQATADGKIVVAYKEGVKDTAKCNQLVEVDLNTGEKGWTRNIKEEGLFDSSLSLEMYISKNTLIVGRSQSGTGLSMSDGHQLWTKKEEEDGVCFPQAFTGGSKVLLSMGCSAGKDTEHERVEELDPDTGKTKWTKEIPKGWSLKRVYSTSPVVLYLTNEDKKQWNISTLKNGSGTTRSQVDINESFSPDCPMSIIESELQGCNGTAADADTLYLPTEADTGANEIVAVNLDTGKERWRVKAPAESSMLPLRVEGGNVIAYQKPTYEAGGAVLSIPTSGGHKPTKLLQHPASTADIENGFYSAEIAYVDGRFVISTTQLTGSDKAQEKLMMAFGK
ncbi:outer membrane protein assembly factor BamB family protein [Streptomyces odontomachi]|uniref:outer membrane protein assembly factor BamB family protein n=1 Tax=Streptomyces odontomachi TaxID=2944940 RepID=UPI00210A2F98|nr:PQQ-binding-like beta-propeller repeat protein [Streptomyces sp. ODS25]